MTTDTERRTVVEVQQRRLVAGATFPDYELTGHDRRRYRLSDVQGSDPMIPHTLVLGTGLRIYRMYNGYWFWGRPSPDELWRDVREVSRRIRPDWDLSDPALRANWNGDKTKHYPYVR